MMRLQGSWGGGHKLCEKRGEGGERAPGDQAREAIIIAIIKYTCVAFTVLYNFFHLVFTATL